MGTANNNNLPRSKSCGGFVNKNRINNNLQISQDQGYNSTTNVNEGLVVLDEVLLHRIAFTVWHTALHLQAAKVNIVCLMYLVSLCV